MYLFNAAFADEQVKGAFSIILSPHIDEIQVITPLDLDKWFNDADIGLVADRRFKDIDFSQSDIFSVHGAADLPLPTLQINISSELNLLMNWFMASLVESFEVISPTIPSIGSLKRLFAFSNDFLFFILKHSKF